MSSQTNKELAIQLMDAISRNDETTLNNLIHPDVVSHGISERHGIDEYKRFFALMHSSFSPWTMVVEDVIAEGDKVVLRILDQGTMTGSYMGMPATGKSYSIPAVQIARFVDGRLVEMWGFRDSAMAAQQLGLMPTH